MSNSKNKNQGQLDPTGKIKWLLPIADFYFVFKHVMFPFIMILIAFFAFCVLDPGIDLMKTIFTSSIIQKFFIPWAVAWWALTKWYGTVEVLAYSKIEYYDKKRSDDIQRLLPIIFGVLTYLTFIIGLIVAEGTGAILYIGYNLVILTLILIFFIYKGNRKFKLFPEIEISSEARTFAFKDVYKKWGILSISFLIFVLSFILIMLIPIAFPMWLTPIGVIILAFISWSAVGLIIKIFDNITLLPIMVMILVLALIFTKWNYNCIVPSASPEISAEDVSVQDYFKKWMDKRIDTSSTEKYPVFIVTAEGGASRASCWTGNVLAELQTQNPEFSSHTFALTSVSGGSLGTSTFAMLNYSQNTGTADFDTLSFREVNNEILVKDFLSPLLAGMLFPDLFQQFLPFRIQAFSRAHFLERSWEKAWKEYTNAKVDAGYRQFALDVDKYERPLLVLNTTHVESGRRGVLAGVEFDPSICDLDDILHVNGLNPDFKLSNAASSSAAFPYLSPGARVRYADSTYGHLVDGGYFENSGVYTAIDIYNQITDLEEYKDKFEVYFIVIRSFKDTYYFKPNMALNNLTDPLNAIFNTRDTRSTHSYTLLKNFIIDHGRDPHKAIYKFQLKASTSEIPVNWYMSDTVIAKIDEEFELPRIQDRIDSLLVLID